MEAQVLPPGMGMSSASSNNSSAADPSAFNQIGVSNSDYSNSLNNAVCSNSAYPGADHSSNVNLMIDTHSYSLNDRHQVNYMSHDSNNQEVNGHHAMDIAPMHVSHVGSSSSLNPHHFNYSMEPDFWCSISYWELNSRVGEIFQASQPSVYVDGYTNPTSPDRFCLGVLSNVNRNAIVEQTRRSIGLGLRIYYIGGQVFAECLSDALIYVQSVSSNRHYGQPDTRVERVHKNGNFKIFDQQEFALELERRVPSGFDAVYQLKDMCTIRISFGKGWGPGYRLQAVTATPCWIEVHLKGPLQWLDRVLTQMETPRIPCSSMS